MLGQCRRVCVRSYLAFARAHGRSASFVITVGDRSCAVQRDGMTVLQVLKQHSYPVDFDCQKGTCKKCQVDVEVEGERAQILACQEKVLPGMHVILDVAPDAHAVKLQEQQARERAQQEMLQRRSRNVGTANKGPPRVVDKRANLDEVKEARAIMASSNLAPAEKLAELQRLFHEMDAGRFFDVVRFCRVDDWIKRHKWGNDKGKAEQLRKYIYDREMEQSPPEVESMA
eukprot:TRINITY_DN94931_c0_g1_i1.p1 TRINITY_DN94931_c0_g1~~TRINITY_DN94931_c0_g1_i1.p1  ORF type:complete len:229 (+),score=43.35 TRINITY_DN94931_c0_g1_i1:63-749(+)